MSLENYAENTENSSSRSPIQAHGASRCTLLIDDKREWNAALREAEIGYTAAAKQQVGAALARAAGRDVRVLAAMTLARAGETARGKGIVDQLEKSEATNTMLKIYWLPTIKAALELNSGNSSQALIDLEAPAPYELGGPVPISGLYPVYVRGLEINPAVAELGRAV